MTEIASPRHNPDHPDTAIDCEFALEPAFQELARRAEAAGWSEDAVAAALLSLGANQVKGITADRTTAAAIVAASRKQ